jgi:hypothetical protein
MLRYLTTLALSFPLPLTAEGRAPSDVVLPVNEAALAKIKGLKANQAVLLGQAQVVGEFNDVARKNNLHKTGPMGRDFTIKMVWAPERRRALFCGANHGVPHRLNDVWEFDLASLSWVLLYAPDNPRDYTGIGKDYSDVEFKDGVLITRRGGPAVIAHTWWGLTYDPEQKMMLFVNTWVTDEKKAVEQLGGDPARLYAGPPLWAFSPHTCRWKMLKTDKPYPRAPFGGLLEFIPELKGSIWHTNNWQMQATWLYDAKANAWKDLKANAKAGDFEKQAPAAEQVGYYDPTRKLVIVQRHKETFHFDPKTVTWKKVLSADKDSDQVPFGHDAYAPMYFDPVSGHGLLVEFKSNTLWSYDPDKVAWTKLRPDGDRMPEGNKRLAYFDPAQGVFVILHGTTVWAYRYQVR